MIPKVKICGITNLIDAKNALQFGADYIGFINIEQSPRYLSIDEITEISRDLNEQEKQKSVLLSLEHSVDKIVSDLTRLGFKTIQPYGNLNLEELCKLKLMGYKIFKPVQVSSTADIKNLDDFRKAVDLIILDSKSSDPAQLGGTGTSFNWDIFNQAKDDLEINLALSGGLTLDNIEEALIKTEASMIDLSSGLELRPGLKSCDKIKELFNLLLSISSNDLEKLS